MISQFAGEYEIELIEHYLREDKTQLKLREGLLAITDTFIYCWCNRPIQTI